MAYSDYVQIYNVMDSAGITETDDLATQCTKIATWVNATFSDIVTAEVLDENKVIIVDNAVKMGVIWGNCYSTYIGRRITYYRNNAWNYESQYEDNNGYDIENLKLFVCKTSNGYVIDFLSGTLTDWKSTPRFMVANSTNSLGTIKKVGIGGRRKEGYYGSPANWSWYVISEGAITLALDGYSQEDFLGRANPICNKTLLTKFTPINTDLICSTLYKMDGTMPNCKSIFELNGSKYLSLNYFANGLGCGLALKLD